MTTSTPTTIERNRTVLVLGSTGLVGRALVDALRQDPSVREVRALARRPVPEESGRADAATKAEARVVWHVVDFDQIEREEHAVLFDGVDSMFCALGTTRRQAGSRGAFRRVDLELPLRVARLARSRGVRHLLHVSVVGASRRSLLFYYRVKGELEHELKLLEFPALTIARPSFLAGTRADERPGERLGLVIARLFPQRWMPVAAVQVARAMARSSLAQGTGAVLLENVQLREA